MLLFEHLRLHLATLLPNLVVLLNNEITTTNVLVSDAEGDHGVELLVVVHLVQVHAVGEHLLHVADFDRHVRREERAVDVDAARVNVVEAPDPEMLHVVLEVGTRHEVKGLVLHNGCDWDVQKVRTADDVALEFDELRQLSLDVAVDVLAGDTDFLLGPRVDHVPGAHVCVLRPRHTVGGPIWPDEVDVAELVTTGDNTWNSVLFRAVFKGISRLSLSERVQEGLDLGDCTLTDVHLSQFPRIDVDLRLKLVKHAVTGGTPSFLWVRRRAQREVNPTFDHLLNDSLSALLRDLGGLLTGRALPSEGSLPNSDQRACLLEGTRLLQQHFSNSCFL